MDAILSGLGAGLGFAALHYAQDNILKDQDLTCLCPPLGAVAVLLFCMPNAPASQPKAVIGGHLVAGVVAYGVLQTGVAYPEAISVAFLWH
jgi:CBS-domain-containing membrane protein